MTELVVLKIIIDCYSYNYIIIYSLNLQLKIIFVTCT